MAKPLSNSRKDGETKLKSILKQPTSHADADGKSTKSTKKPLPDEPVGPRPLSRREKEKIAAEDAEIAALEKRLGIKNKKLPKSFAEDGLDALLGDLGGEDDSGGLSTGKRRRAEDVEWLERKRRKVADEIPSGSEDEDDEEDDDEEKSTGVDMDDALDLDSSEEGSELEGGSGDMDGIDSEDEDDAEAQGSESDVGDFDGFDSETSDPAPAKRVRENPYVAPGAATEKPVTKYIPPSLRAAPSGDAELAIRLRRQTQGLLNRLSEANLISILGDVEGLYQNNPRQHITATLIDLLLALCCDPSVLNDTFLILHAGFIAAVYKTIGPDFGAQMVERIVVKFDECYNGGVTNEKSGKETLNLISLLAQLYNLQVIGCDLIFDYIRTFLDELSEAHTELLLRVVRCKLSTRHISQNNH